MTLAQAIFALLGTIAGIVAVVLTHRYDATAARASSIAEARKELQAALATKKFDDAAFWARRLRELNALPEPAIASKSAPKEPPP